MISLLQQYFRLTIDDWVAVGGHVEFKKACPSERHRGAILCEAWIRHHGNLVFGKGWSDASGDAVVNAIEQI